MMRRNAGDYVKRWGAALIRGAATNAEFRYILLFLSPHNVLVVLHFLPPPFLQSSRNAAGRDDPGATPAVFLLLIPTIAADGLLPSTAGRIHSPGMILDSIAPNLLQVASITAYVIWTLELVYFVRTMWRELLKSMRQ